MDPRRAAYDLKTLRGKGMVCKIGSSRRYECAKQGLQAMTALVVLQEKVIQPLLAASQHPEPQTKLQQPTPIRSPLRTSSGRYEGPICSTGGRRVRIDNLFFICAYKRLAPLSCYR